MGIDFGDIAAILGGGLYGAAAGPQGGQALYGMVDRWKNQEDEADDEARTKELQAREDQRWARTQETWARDKAREDDYDEDRVYTEKQRAHNQREWAREDADQLRDDDQEEKDKRSQKSIIDNTTGHSAWEAYRAERPGAMGRMDAGPIAESKAFNSWLASKSSQEAADAATAAEETRWNGALDAMMQTEAGQEFYANNPHLAHLGVKEFVKAFGAQQSKGAKKDQNQIDLEYSQAIMEIDDQIGAVKQELQDELDGGPTEEAAAMHRAVFGQKIKALQHQRGLITSTYAKLRSTPWEPKPQGSMDKPAETDEEKLKAAARAEAGL